VAALGGRPTVVGIIGDDEAGRACRAELARLHPDTAEALIVVPGRPTTLKSRVLADGALIVRVDTEDVSPVDAAIEQTVRESCERLVSSVDACMVSDYDKGAAPPDVCRSVIEAATAAHVPVIVDPKGSDLSFYVGATVVTPNARELFDAAGEDAAPDADRVERIAEVGRRVAARLPGTNVVVTADRDGMILVDSAGLVAHVPSDATVVVDPTGAGDAVTATLAVALGSGLSVLDAVLVASRVAATVVARRGTAPIDAAEMVERLGSSRSG